MNPEQMVVLGSKHGAKIASRLSEHRSEAQRLPYTDAGPPRLFLLSSNPVRPCLCGNTPSRSSDHGPTQLLAPYPPSPRPLPPCTQQPDSHHPPPLADPSPIGNTAAGSNSTTLTQPLYHAAAGSHRRRLLAFGCIPTISTLLLLLPYPVRRRLRATASHSTGLTGE